MSLFYSYKIDYFYPIIVISVGIHLLLVAFSGFAPQKQELSIKPALSSLEIIFVEKQLTPKAVITKQEKAIPNTPIDQKNIMSKNDVLTSNKGKIVVEKGALAQLPDQKLKFKDMKSSLKDISQHKPFEKTISDTMVSQIKPYQPYSQPNTSHPDVGVRAEPKALEHLNNSPVYPRLAYKRGWEGRVLLKVDVAGNGRVIDIHIHKSSGYPILDQSALKAVRKWRFTSGDNISNHYVSSTIVPVRFNLTDE